ncbi:hypothetical protein [Cognatishimia sp.]|uniref:hypothetical protein n=1 Tax=Cognatishimia sp. TaxID=2211648 RepID=UPI0035147BC4|nr:hypothetical protein [Cognatishimia sp.]
MQRFLGAMILTLGAVGTASAEPEKAPNTDHLCEGFENRAEGVWLDGQEPAVLFRLAWNVSGNGCYAWLNTYANWGIHSPGAIQTAPFALVGEIWKTANNSFTIDTEIKKATYSWQGANAVGPVTELHFAKKK